MTTSSELDQIVAEIRSAAQDGGAMVVDAVLSLESTAVPVAVVECSELPSLIAHVRPRLIYMKVVTFDASDDLESMMGDEGMDEPEFRSLIARWNTRKGQTARIACSVMGDGVLHGAIKAAEWVDEFDTEAEATVSAYQRTAADKHEREREAERLKADAQERKRLAPHVKKLLADIRFSASKTSAAKRLALAEIVLPYLDRPTLRQIVERATTELWLQTNGT